MSNMFDQFRNMASLMGQAKELKAKAEALQEELARRMVEGDAGAGAVRVIANGKLEILRVQLDAPLLTALAGSGESADHAMIEELIASATNDALTKARAMVAEELSRLSGGMDLSGIPGLDKLLGQ